MGIAGWILLVLVILVVIIIMVGQPKDEDILTWEISPTVFKRGYNKTISAGRAFSTEIAKETLKAQPKQVEKFALMGETFPPLKPRIDVFDKATIGSDAAAKIHTKAFEVDVDNRLRSLRLSEPEIVRPYLAGSAFLWTGDYEGRKEVQSNPFVKLSIVNPTEMSELLPDRAF